MVKRKRDAIDNDSEDDEPSFGRQILPVANLPENFSGEPQDGLQYLFTVRRDARRLPHVTSVINPYATPEDTPALQESNVYVPQYAVPSEQWFLLFIKRFKNLRKNAIQQTIGVGSPALRKEKRIPAKKERDAWWAFISGMPECEWNKSIKHTRDLKKPKGAKTKSREMSARGEAETNGESQTHEFANEEVYQIDEDGEVQLNMNTGSSEALPTPAATPKPQFHLDSSDGNLDSHNDLVPTVVPERVLQYPVKTRPREPTPVILSLLDSRFRLHILMYFNYWMQQYLEQPDSRILTDTHSRWVFALLAHVEEDISAEDTSLLRTLSRTCLEIIKKRYAEEYSEPISEERIDNAAALIGEATCWMVIAAVAGFWKQRDLWSEAGLTFTD